MKTIHPKRSIRKALGWFRTAGFRLQCRFFHVHYEIGQNTRIRHCQVRSKENGTLVIGDGCKVSGAYFGFYGSGGKIELRDHIVINAYPNRPVSLYVKDQSSILIESGCLLSNFVDISTTDWHQIYDDQGEHLNPEKNVHIGRRVWVGRKVIICKGVSIPDNTIIGAGSVVTKSFGEMNVIIAGNPAEIKKRGIHR